MQMPYADLVVDSVQACRARGINGQPLQVTWSVSNIGLGITNSSEWHDRVYLTSDPSGQTGLREIDSFSHAGAGIGRRLYSRRRNRAAGGHPGNAVCRGPHGWTL